MHTDKDLMKMQKLTFLSLFVAMILFIH